jgi:pentatricopeptide repeat protein
MYIASGDYPIAEEFFNQIKEPNVQNYVGLMNYYNQSKNWTRTLQLYDQMKTQRKIQADVPTYLAVLLAIKEMNNIDKAKEIQEDLLKQNLWQNHVEIQKLLQEILKISD